MHVRVVHSFHWHAAFHCMNISLLIHSTDEHLNCFYFLVVSSFFIIVLKCNLYIIKFTPWKCTIERFLVYPELCDHHCYLILKHFPYPKRNLVPFRHHSRKWQPAPVFFLGNSRDRGAWQAAGHGVTKSQTRLSNWAQALKRASASFTIDPPILNISHAWNHTRCVLSCLDSLCLMFLKFIHVVARVSTSLLSIAE